MPTTTLDSRCLDAFPAWLRSLGEDARALAALLEASPGADAVKRYAASALNYLFKSLDLIPDGLEDLGFIDDTFVLRAAAELAQREQSAQDPGPASVLVRLAGDAELIREFLGHDYSRLANYVASLGRGAVRGRTADDIVANASTRQDFVREVREWADSYAMPAFARDARNLVKLRSFLLAKLPA
jgi:uncharacterized membrane protein YkvA (DUF1232 family)